jgi:polysaccharide pyruvyl transferase WcaK-like protein
MTLADELEQIMMQRFGKVIGAAIASKRIALLNKSRQQLAREDCCWLVEELLRAAQLFSTRDELVELECALTLAIAKNKRQFP